MRKTTITARVIDQTLHLVNCPLIASGGVDELKINFEFCSLWDGCGKTAVFYRDPEAVYHASIVDGMTTVPYEVLTDAGYFHFGMMGAADNLRTTEVLRVKVVQGAITEATNVPKEPTPDIYQQLLAAYGQAEHNLTTEVAERKQADATEKAERQAADAAETAERKAEIAVERARINNLAKLQEGSTTGDAEIVDARVDFNGQTHENVGTAMRAVGGNVADLNKQTGQTLTNGKYIYSATGGLVNDENFGISDFIPCYPGAAFTYRGESGNSYIYVVAFYDREKKFISGLSNTGASDTLLDGVVPEGCWYMRLTYRVTKIKTAKCAVESPVMPAWVDEVKQELANRTEQLAADIEQVGGDVAQIKGRIVRKSPASVYANVMTPGEPMILPHQTSVKQNTSLRFAANIEGLSDDFVLYLGIGASRTSTYGEYIKITPTAIAFMIADTSGGNIAHNIAEFKDYLFVSLALDSQEKATIKVQTNGGSYTQSDIAWVGHNGAVFAELEAGATLSECELTWNCSDFDRPVWMYGDSYFTYWPKQLRNFGYNTVLLDGYPGETAAGGLRDFKACLMYGTPQFAVWCLGMNNPDTSASVNADWLACVQEFIEICKENGITPILSTIPCVTSTGNKNEKKNAWVRNSGHRYVDFAKAVNGLTDGQDWYTGMLSSDKVHPTTEGAKCLAARVLIDVPEINHA